MIRTYESGVFAVWRHMIAAYPHLKLSQGTIISMGSGAGTMAVPTFGAYGSNKEAIRGLSRIAAKEWGPDQIIDHGFTTIRENAAGVREASVLIGERRKPALGSLASAGD